MPCKGYEQLKGDLIYLPHYVLNVEMGFDIVKFASLIAFMMINKLINRFWILIRSRQHKWDKKKSLDYDFKLKLQFNMNKLLWIYQFICK